MSCGKRSQLIQIALLFGEPHILLTLPKTRLRAAGDCGYCSAGYAIGWWHPECPSHFSGRVLREL